MKSLLEQIPEPFPQPTKKQLKELVGLIELINFKATTIGLSFHQIAAEYFVRICVGHKLIDGNKRTAVIVLDVFYALNMKTLPFSEEQVAKYAIAMASIQTSQTSVEKKILFMNQELL
ncbi:MAG: type II toxin-antitoxin system death-on-curing family toxin [Pseudomonadales bacterium]|nr:type II toxin-antitoxin system death-on-curing family toxin [Candidatus Woesebacteria bacterium]MCB9801645.1 type II toxin-antitoxin system death-on-curing family toxin [Pseudomonadales bacterium]